MNQQIYRIVSSTIQAIVIFTLLSVASAPFSVASAQEDMIGPPEVLQYPFEAVSDTQLGLKMQVLRVQIEQGARLALCKILTLQAQRPVPADFQVANCDPTFGEKVDNGEGLVRWPNNARPTQCGEGCVGRPFMTCTQFVDWPNMRRAMLYGHLTFVVDIPGLNRDITYGYEVYFDCDANNGSRVGRFAVHVQFDAPVIGEPGPLESILDFLLPGDISRHIEDAIREQLRPVGDVTKPVDACRSIGIHNVSGDPEVYPKYDPAPAKAPFGADIGSPTSLRDRVTVHFLRIARKPLPVSVGVDPTAAVGSAAGHFKVYLNGASAEFPPKLSTEGGGIDLPEGGAIDLDYCRTIDVTDSDRLQVLFTNGLGGAVWSQFARGDSFGADSARTITTGRTIVVPGAPGVPSPVPGPLKPPKPEAVILREFELTYTITFAHRPDTITTEPLGPGSHSDHGAIAGVLGHQQPISIDPSAPTPPPCRKI